MTGVSESREASGTSDSQPAMFGQLFSLMGVELSR